MDKEHKIAIVRRIAKTIAIEYIYGIEFGGLEERNLHLIILVPSPVRTKLTELAPFVDMALSGVSRVTYKIYQTSEARRLLSSGSIYFLVACSEKKLLCNAVDTSPLEVKTLTELDQIAELAKSVFEAAKARIGSFVDGAKFYMEKQDLPVSLFMLHQVCELSCRALELGLFGIEKRSHQLSEHRKFITALLPDFNLLTEDHNNDMGRNLLNLFDKCYSSVRYENAFTVEDVDIQLAYDIANGLSNTIDHIFHDFLSRLAWISSIPQPLEQVTTTLEPVTASIASKKQDDINHDGDVLDIIVEIIKEYLMPEAIFLFGKHEINFSGESVFQNQSEIAGHKLRFEMLVVSDVQNPYGFSLKDRFDQKFDATVSVLLLVHGKNEYHRALHSSDNFINLIARSAKLLLGNAPILATVDNNIVEQQKTCLEIKMMNRNSRAMELWECSGQVLDEGSMVLAASLLSQAVEQSCLGLIEKFLNYRPNMHRLGHLLDICSVFWPDAQHYFPRSIEVDKQMFKTMSNGQSLARHNSAEIPAHNEIWGIYRRAEAFINAAKLLTEGKKSDND